LICISFVTRGVTFWVSTREDFDVWNGDGNMLKAMVFPSLTMLRFGQVHRGDSWIEWKVVLKQCLSKYATWGVGFGMSMSISSFNYSHSELIYYKATFIEHLSGTMYWFI
jgi:hypothetical protein